MKIMRRQMKEQRLVILLVFFLLLAAELFAAYFLTDDVNCSPETGIRVMSWLGLPVLAAVIVSWRTLRRETVCPYIFFFLAMFLFCYGQSFGWMFGIDMGPRDLWNRTENGLDRATVLKAMCYTLPAMTAFHIGAVMAVGDREKLRTPENNRLTIRTYQRIARVLLIIVIPAFLASTYSKLGAARAGGYGAIYVYQAERSTFSGILTQLGNYYQPCMLLMLVAHRDKTRVRNIIIALMLVDVAADLYIGGRSPAVMTLMGILLTWHIFVRPIRFRQLLILLVIGYVLMTLMTVISSKRGEANRSLLDYLTALAEPGNSSLLAIVGELGWSMTSTAWTMLLVPGEYAFRFGLTYLVSVLAPIPNIGFWAVHPTRQFADLAHWLQDAMHMRYGPGYTIVAESYINFGWFGIAAMIAVGAVMVRVIARVSNKNAENNVLGMTFQIMIIMTIMKSLVRSSFSAAVRDIAYVLIPLYLLIWDSTRREVATRL